LGKGESACRDDHDDGRRDEARSVRGWVSQQPERCSGARDQAGGHAAGQQDDRAEGQQRQRQRQLAQRERLRMRSAQLSHECCS
jgi:hypothetical protein